MEILKNNIIQLSSTSIILGFFDGIHLGHREVINTAVNFAKKNKTKTLLITFKSSPAEYFNNKTKEEAHREFFLNTLECVKTFDCFNCLGHLDYIVRYGPYEDKNVNHELYQDIIDEIFKTLIQKGKGIEVNTSGYRDLKTCGFPSFKQVERYYQLGGRIITVGTDSHTSDRIGEHVEEVVREYQRIGFQDISTFTKRIRD